jgi:hypothetical protein
MALPTPKELKKLAAACRAAGITHFKGEGIEFTLSERAPEKKSAKKVQPTDFGSPIDPNFTSDEMTQDQMLFWSSATLPEANIKAEN